MYQHSSRKRVLFTLILFILFIFLYFNSSMNTDSQVLQRVQIEESFKSRSIITTAKGNVTLKQVENEVYLPLGYYIVDSNACFPLLCIAKLKQESCEIIFEDWLKIATNYKIPEKPPSKLEDNQIGPFTLNGHIPLNYRYEYHNYMPYKRDDWLKENIIKKYMNDDFNTCPYSKEGAAVYYATKDHNINGQNGMVIGSIVPWVEGMCLKNGANEIITVDYNAIETDHEQIKFVHAMDLARNFTMYQNHADFIVSFSSLEHSGLGRFNDPLDPIGDIREMQKIKCLLKPGAKLFVGTQVGEEWLDFHLHRIYGKLRLPLLLEGFRLLDMYQNDIRLTNTKQLLQQMSANKWPGYNHILFVLEKIK